MDLYKAIGELRARKEQLEKIISQLEELQTVTGKSAVPVKRRGRKSMGAKERAEVSKRMKNYWASRAKQQKGRSAS